MVKIAVIPLTQGKSAIVDAEDLDKVAVFRWYATEERPGLWYAKSSINGMGVARLHRLILGLRPGEKCDHVNGDGLDCRKINLRKATYSQNNCNKGPINILGIKGVSRRGNTYRANIKYFGKNFSLGNHPDKFVAARFYDEAARLVHGDFAFLNFPDHSDCEISRKVYEILHR